MRSASAPPSGRQQSDRQEGTSGDHNGPRRLSGVCDHERPDGDRLHPRSDDRHEATRPKERVVPMTQRCERGEPWRLGRPRGASRLSLRLRDRLRIERRRLRVPGHRVRLGGAHLRTGSLWCRSAVTSRAVGRCLERIAPPRRPGSFMPMSATCRWISSRRSVFFRIARPGACASASAKPDSP